MRIALSAVLLICALPISARASGIEHAITFLQREVASWKPENGCFSCHNNGDGARVLYLAERQGHSVSRDSLAETTAWLKKPQLWHENKGDPGVSDKRLALIQFAAALQANRTRTKTELELMAGMLEKEQDPAGFWKIEGEPKTSSPAAYGTELATCMALLCLEKARGRDAETVRRAREWLLKQPVHSVVTASSCRLALRNEQGEGARRKRKECLDYLLSAQGRAGGWGPFPENSPQAFDTALALLALADEEGAEAASARRKGRDFLLGEQELDGGWPATTRPPRGESYAQRISTSAWALMALLKPETN